MILKIDQHLCWGEDEPHMTLILGSLKLKIHHFMASNGKHHKLSPEIILKQLITSNVYHLLPINELIQRLLPAHVYGFRIASPLRPDVEDMFTVDRPPQNIVPKNCTSQREVVFQFLFAPWPVSCMPNRPFCSDTFHEGWRARPAWRVSLNPTESKSSSSRERACPKASLKWSRSYSTLPWWMAGGVIIFIGSRNHPQMVGLWHWVYRITQNDIKRVSVLFGT